ncbi:TonB-dependent receptor plug domain-containing protein [Sphingobacterium bovistauri]|uniref:TonB-dependent receptor plug domain-containing protein n=1 Tax=Sphingobacterium bovistauri TaxID=2781959 RepID=A0ABS7Z806_9SPHI|nr:TonB-dependent receptor plug domain-containing protein [Sphingobacterium bovistauri]MCA5005682.1 TonB-dependent receptor plug domain-containing protein [Sphingobacterium bovistauri]
MKQGLLSAIFLFIISYAHGQDIQQFLEKLEGYQINNPQEKVYLHTDKPSYSAGEPIFFKSYTTIGVKNLFSSLSGVLYAELISPSNDIVQRVTISTPMGAGIGDFTLSDTITEGVYRIRAYTNWMKNAGSEYFFEKRVPVFNGRTDNVLTQTTTEVGESDVIYKINLNSISGLPIAKKRIQYAISEGDKVVERKSKSSTDLGLVEISVSNKYRNPILKLRFENVDKSMVNKIVKTIDPKLIPVTKLFPEGGKLVYGRINNIAAKSINSQGLGVGSKILLKQGNDSLGVINTNELGMGAISVFLNSNAPIEALATYSDGSSVRVEAPEVYESGFSLLVNNLNENKVFAQLSISSNQINNADVYFIVHHLGEVLFVSRAKANKEELVFSVDKQKLPSGVLTLSILNSQFQPLIERPIFHYAKRDLLINKIALNKDVYKVREKVNVSMEVGEVSDSLRYGAFSASVIDLSKVNTSYTDEAHILSSLLLNNDLRGYIEKPNFYFQEDGGLKNTDMDYLMLTQGWSNVDWSKLDLDIKHKYMPEKLLKLSGYTKKIGRSKPEPNAKLQLISTQNYLDFIDTTSNEEGYFEFNNMMFPDSVKFIITAKDGQKGKNNIDIVMDEDLGYPIEDRTAVSDKWWDINRKYLENLKSSKEYFAELERVGLKEKAILIEEVLVTARQTRKASEHSSNLNGSGNADQIITEEDLSTCTTLEMCLSGRLVGVYFQGGVPYNTRGNQPMQVVLDGMYIEGDNLSMINILDIESVEVLRNSNYTTVYGSNGANGLIILTSKRGTSAMRNYVPKGILTVRPQGFHTIKSFYKPAYDVSENIMFNSDLRSTIHWEPSIVSDAEGKSSFHFFTSDAKGRYLLLLEGLDLNGRLLHRHFEFIVD